MLTAMEYKLELTPSSMKACQYIWYIKFHKNYTMKIISLKSCNKITSVTRKDISVLQMRFLLFVLYMNAFGGLRVKMT